MAYCPHCGAGTNPGASFCTACGTTLTPAAPPPTIGAPAPHAPAAPSAYAAPPVTQRPVGVTIVGIVMIVGSILGILAILGLIFMAMVIGTAFSEVFGGSSWFEWFELGASIAAAFLLVAALFVIAFAVFALLTGLGSLRGASWAWAATIVIMALTGLNSLASLASRDTGGLLGLLASAAVIWYYFRPEVKAWFKRA